MTLLTKAACLAEIETWTEDNPITCGYWQTPEGGL
jgi:hypothetical protein